MFEPSLATTYSSVIVFLTFFIFFKLDKIIKYSNSHKVSHLISLILCNTLPNRSQVFLANHFSKKIVWYNKNFFLKLTPFTKWCKNLISMANKLPIHFSCLFERKFLNAPPCWMNHIR